MACPTARPSGKTWTMADEEPSEPKGDRGEALYELVLKRLHSDDEQPAGATRPSRAKRTLWESLRRRPSAHDRYRVGDAVGRGGMGLVERVRDLDLERDVARKTLAGDLPGPVLDALQERFLEEAQVTGQLDHPGIVPIHDLGLDEEGRPFFTMRLVQGRDLAERLRSQADPDWSSTRALQVLLRVAETVAFAHAKGVLHRDLKPANVMLGGFGEVYVMDWGLAKVLSPDGVPLTGQSSERDVLGTPSYMSPEQAVGADVGPATDVYSLGTILYEIVAGHAPFAEVAHKSHEVLQLLRARPPRALERANSRAPAELVAICARAMERDPSRRYPGVAAFAADVRAYLEGHVVEAHRTGALAELQKWVLRNRLVSFLAMACVLALGTGLATVTHFYLRSLDDTRALQLASIETQRGRFRRLSDRAPDLWPVGPDLVAPLERWLAEMEELRAQVPVLLATLEKSAPDDERVAHLAELHGALLALDQPSDPEAANARGVGIASLRRRLRLSRDVRPRSLDSPGARAAWTAARAAVADRYGGFDLAPQLGLLPLGPDPSNGLWEFAHVASGEVPTRDRHSSALQLGPESAIVLVLVPGGEAWIGATADAAGPNFDPHLGSVSEEAKAFRRSEGPVHRVHVSPFFLGKHELTRAQYRRMSGTGTGDDAIAPVASIDWYEARRTLAHFGLQLPSEPQREYACRAHTHGPWCLGETAAEVLRRANLREPDADDVGPVPAYVGATNPFGLVHMLGNVHEWCEDMYAPYTRDARNVLDADDSSPRVVRGGSFLSPALRARSSWRMGLEPTYREETLGVRPMCPILSTSDKEAR
ncbi:MAG: SUMF1/EgtB/PvdO family nonheme iron enzyme [bacterium]|nr:SUMF1/EgtB/PvdO family nonheme iron enzyme [bacterium]